MIRLRTLLYTGLLALAAGCGAVTSISAESYNQSCSVEADCVEIFVGDVCSCRCDYAAINRSDLSRYQADRARITCLEQKLCGPCQSAAATCTAGRCVIK
jgi:hypothetical protein